MSLVSSLFTGVTGLASNSEANQKKWIFRKNKKD